MNRSVTNEDMLRAILDIGGGLHREFDDLKRILSQNIAESDSLKPEEANKLLTRELEELSRHISNTKREIALIRGEGGNPRMDRISAANFELDAIVKHTEEATDRIMTETEDIDSIVSKLKADTSDAAHIDMLNQINAKVVSIYEHCNFQDITGQRISKVIKTLNYIETRIENMLRIWGGSLESAVDETANPDDEREVGLLNGPQLPTDAVSQGEIDSLFGTSPSSAG